MNAVNPFVDQRVAKLESLLDEFIVSGRYLLEDVKSTISNRYFQTRYDSSYRFCLGERYTFYGRLYWVAEESGAVPYVHIELALADIPEHWRREPDFFEFLLELNGDFHDPIKIGILDHNLVGLVIRGRVDKVTPDYYERMLEDLLTCGDELFGKLRHRFGTKIRSLGDYLDRLYPEFPKKLAK